MSKQLPKPKYMELKLIQFTDDLKTIISIEYYDQKDLDCIVLRFYNMTKKRSLTWTHNYVESHLKSYGFVDPLADDHSTRWSRWNKITFKPNLSRWVLMKNNYVKFDLDIKIKQYERNKLLGELLC